MPVSQTFRDWVREQLAPSVPKLHDRSMFGGVGIYAGELFFALLDNDRLYLKVDDSNRADFVAAGMGPFQPFGDDPMTMANYSPWHFIRAFRAAYEETPHAYLVRQRLERARRLLRASPLAIAEIALESGFENRSAFSRLFRQRFGTTAGALRRQAAGGHC